MASPEAEPRRFGKYQILERISAGGMAEIYKARLDGIGGFQRAFAIKRILPHLGGNQDLVDMMVDEAKIAGLLSHANIVQILDLGSIDGQFYIAMEYVNGRDLRMLMDRCNQKSITLPVPHAVFVLIEVLKGLEYAHNRQVMRGGKPVPLNIVHRDIAPGNVLVSFAGEVKLTDFGIAKASIKALETMSGVVKGRFDYMSPEQAAGQPIDQRSDLFSAGVLFYEVLTGVHPFRREGELATLDAIRKGQFIPASEVNPDVPYALEQVLEAALRVDPRERVPSATAFKESLDRFFHDAGFIFSASTLAAFIRGLFPEASGPDRRAAVGDLPTRPLEPDDLELELDESSSASSHRPLTTPGGQGAVIPFPRRPSTQGPLGEESTLIKSAAVLAAEAALLGENPFGESNTVIRPPARPGAEAGDTVRLAVDPSRDRSTVIYPRPSEASNTATPSIPGGGVVTVPHAPSPPVPPPVLPAQPRGARTQPGRRSAGVPMQVHGTWMLVTFAAAVAAFVLGLLVGSRMHVPRSSSSTVVTPEP